MSRARKVFTVALLVALAWAITSFAGALSCVGAL